MPSSALAVSSGFPRLAESLHLASAAQRIAVRCSALCLYVVHEYEERTTVLHTDDDGPKVEPNLTQGPKNNQPYPTSCHTA